MERDKKGRFLKGHKGYKSRLGAKLSEKTRKKLSKTHKGNIPWNKKDKIKKICKFCKREFSVWFSHNKAKYCSVECKNKSQVREDGITPENVKIRNSIEFRLWRKAVFKYDNWTCWICEIRGGKLHSHHLKRFSEYPELRLKVSTGLTLCEFCHRIYTKFGLRKKWEKKLQNLLKRQTCGFISLLPMKKEK